MTGLASQQQILEWLSTNNITWEETDNPHTRENIKEEEAERVGGGGGGENGTAGGSPGGKEVSGSK
jgi:hypothetical protein